MREILDFYLIFQLIFNTPPPPPRPVDPSLFWDDNNSVTQGVGASLSVVEGMRHLGVGTQSWGVLHLETRTLDSVFLLLEGVHRRA